MSKKSLLNIKVGDIVWCGGDSGFCDDSHERVTNISVRYDSKTGKPYNRIHLKDDIYDSRNGACIKGAMAYYIQTI